MKSGNLEKLALLILVSVLTAACSQESNTQPPAMTEQAPDARVAEPSAPANLEEPEDVILAEGDSLGGTSWRLVQIMSMDDSTFVPDDPSLYTLNFNTDGTMNVLADCNRGNGSWTSESDSQLQFGAIAATMAMCPPGSLHDQYMAQFAWVRSYVMRDGHLFLATMADGSIIEFEPIESD